MPRIPRGLGAGGVAHIVSRGNRRATVFHTPNEYDEFVELLRQVHTRHRVDFLAFCVMPNHFHLVARFEDPGELSALMQSWLTSHARRYHLRHGTTGHVWQGRFKSFPVQEDQHLLTVLRYVLLNPVRAGLVQQPLDWRWSSLHFASILAPWPVAPPCAVGEWLAQPSEMVGADALRNSLQRGAPFGTEGWRDEVARALGLESTMRRPGRPRRAPANADLEVLQSGSAA